MICINYVWVQVTVLNDKVPQLFDVWNERVPQLFDVWSDNFPPFIIMEVLEH